MFRILFSFLCLYLFSLPITAASLEALEDLLPKGAQVSYIIAGQEQQNSQTLMLPASTQKLLTALTAKLYLPDNFNFKTHINGTVTKNELNNTEFVFNGDPSFTRAHLRRMLQNLKQQGITAIAGDIQLNIGRFNGYNWSNGQVWNDQGVCYATQASALIINGNCVLGNLKRNTGSINSNIASVYIPSYQPVTITSTVEIITKDKQQSQFCDLEVMRKNNNHYQLFGCITPSKKPLPLSFAVSDPISYFSAILRQELQQLNIHFNADININQQVTAQPTLLTHESGSLDTLLRTMLKDSDNLIADVLFKTIGAEYYQQSGNYRNGASAIQAILAEHGIDLTQAYIADGSGLSRHNLLSAQMLYDSLNYIIKHDKELQLIDMLPISGKDGTLQYRRGLLSKTLKGKIKAKTGSLKGAANMVGIATTKTNQQVPFVLMINGYNPVQRTSNKPAPLTQYLSAFFNNIVTQ